MKKEKIVCKVKDFDSVANIYSLEFPNGKIKEYHYNKGKQVLVGKNSCGKNIDIYNFSRKGDTKLEIEEVDFSIVRGYAEVDLNNPHKDYAHRIVCYSWNGAFNWNYHVDHKNNNKLDNRPKNLEAVPPIINTFRAYCDFPDDRHQKYFMDQLEKDISGKSGKEILDIFDSLKKDYRSYSKRKNNKTSSKCTDK